MQVKLYINFVNIINITKTNPLNQAIFVENNNKEKHIWEHGASGVQVGDIEDFLQIKQNNIKLMILVFFLMPLSL